MKSTSFQRLNACHSRVSWRPLGLQPKLCDCACLHEGPSQQTAEEVDAARIRGCVPTCGMWRCVALIRTELSEERIVCLIRVKRIGGLGTTLAVTSNRSLLKRTNSVALSPQANYTDWATATCRRNLVPTFVDRGVSRGQRGGSPTVVNLSFLDRSH
jgi:hypothetical protein